jgi:hypothetical protein
LGNEARSSTVYFEIPLLLWVTGAGAGAGSGNDNVGVSVEVSMLIAAAGAARDTKLRARKRFFISLLQLNRLV